MIVALVVFLAAVLVPVSAVAQCDGDQRFAVAVYHFNVQYVAGGLQGYPEDLGFQNLDEWNALDLTDAGIQDLIVRESFLPLLQMYERHPGWGGDLELQGLMVDVIRERHPDVLALMGDLDGQVAWDSMHYSDELWTHQPRAAIQRSLLETQSAFDAAGLTRSASVFTQEGQFSLGMGDFLPAGSVAMIPRNLFGLHYPTQERAPLWTLGDSGVFATVGGHGWTHTEAECSIEVRWTFMDDGELLATGDINPYFATAFVADPEVVAAYEAELEELEAQGYVIATVGAAVQALRASAFEPTPMPPVLDGTWQPRNTANLGRWMGDQGEVFGDRETDGAIRTAWWTAYAEVLAAQTLDSDGASVDAAWRELLLAGVSDATGWNPYITEMNYAFEHAAAARELVAGVLMDAVVAAGCEGMTRIDGGTGAVACGAEPDQGRSTLADPQRDLVAGASSGGVAVQVQWFTDAAVPGAERAVVTFSGLSAVADQARQVEIGWEAQSVDFVPAGSSAGVVSVPLALFADAEAPVGIPLAGGVLGLGGDDWLVVDPREVGVAARVHPDQGFVTFLDDTRAVGDSDRWEFWFVTGQAGALALARALIDAPDVYVAAPVIEPAPDIDEDCYCGTVEPSAARPLWALVLGAVLARRRRARR